MQYKTQAVAKPYFIAAVGLFVGQILFGLIQPGTNLPPVRRLAEQYRVNASTVQRALAHVEALGLVEIRHPDRFVARYSLVMFHRIPYTEAWERGRAQGAILDELLRDKSELAEVDLAEAARLVDTRLAEVSAP